MTRWTLLPVGSLLIVTLFYVNTVHGAAVMSVDLGSEWMKVGVVSPGVPMEMALNKESKRKSPAVLAYRDGIRTFGEDAQSIAVRFPESSYFYLLDLLGKTIDNPIVQLYKQRFPYYNIIGDEKRNTVVFKNGEEKFSVEELVAQILLIAKEFAQEYTGQIVQDCVLIVPGFFAQAERSALLAAAQLANLKVLQLINDYSAVALNYGVFRRTEINETAQYYVFYDMGAQKTEAVVVSYQLVKDKATKETNPVVQILGVGYDRTLGGLEIQLRLRDYLAKEFNKLKKTKTDVFTNHRALAKLFKEAGRLKNVLSANAEFYAQIENLLEDIDFKLPVKRQELESICEDLWPRVVKPLQQALTTAGLSLDVINQVILVGGGTRVPKVQEILREHINQDLGKNINADEAAAMGAVYKAADLATGFKVKKFVVKDAVIFPIQIEFERDPGDGSPVKQFKRKLFGHMNPYPQKKFIAFNKHVDDFEFHVNYADLNHLSQEEVAVLGSLNISHIQLKNVAGILEKNKGENIESKGIKAHFAVDDSGILSMTGVEFHFEKQKVGDDDEESTLSKLGSTFSKLFAGDASAQEKKEEVVQDAVNATIPDAEPKNETESKLNESNTVEKDTAKNETVKIVLVKEPVEHVINHRFVKPLDGDDYEESVMKLQALNKAESDRRRRESAFNSLESFVIEAQQRMDMKEYATCATEEEKTKILQECAAISEWLYDDGGQQAEAEDIEKRLIAVEEMINPVYARHWEHQERPEALKALSGMIESAKKFLTNVKNYTKGANAEKDILTTVEIESLRKAVTETEEWQKAEIQTQGSLKNSDPVRLTVKDVVDKINALDREIKYLLNKIKIWKPKKKAPKTVDKEKASKNGTVEETPKSDQAEEQVEKAPPKEDAEEASVESEDTKEAEREPETQTPHGEL